MSYRPPTNEKVFSFEFFPPRTPEGIEKLKGVRDRLALYNPLFFSVTFGAGGTTRDDTFETVIDIQKESGIDAAPHLSCIGSTQENISAILKQYMDNDISRIVALRGDLPSGMRDVGEFQYANELVEFIRKETGDHFLIEVACYPEFHPQATSPQDDLINFKRKVDAGADSAITQYFFNPDSYFSFVESTHKLGVEIPIIPGIMPITNYTQLARFSDACGAEIPRWIRKRLEGYGDDMESLKAFGIEVVTSMCDTLLNQGVPGLHFYTMNQANTVISIWENLGLAPLD
ncbi:MAG: methylenetetrahydrofolate reductase [NAD(P)H] [Gammaproteobacteria bacterium]|nr:MAG: methylenetetrahydrofolate reductase [NAD(P)H] [Gammaproteobacteria bacterium]